MRSLVFLAALPGPSWSPGALEAPSTAALSPSSSSFALIAPQPEELPEKVDAAPAPVGVTAPAAGESPGGPSVDLKHSPGVTFNGYAEAFYQWNFNTPSNGVTHYRGFDNRHNSFTLSNVAIGAALDDDALLGRVTLQVGHTPSTYYLSEPFAPGAGGTNGSNADLWKYLQQAYGGYRWKALGGLSVTAGLFLSAIGPESMAVHENWNWSRSNLFFGLPFYHTGVRLSYALSDVWSATIAVYNGWNSVVDNNPAKSVSGQLVYSCPKVVASMLYFGGIERPLGAPEGPAWRHLVDAHVTWHLVPWLSLLAHGNAGAEVNRFGVSSWAASALSTRFRLAPSVFVTTRGDAFFEQVATNALGRATPLFWPAPWVASATGTLDVRPHARTSFRLEYRHDEAGADMFFGGDVAGDGGTTPFAVNRSKQDTLTAGLTAWF